MRITSGPTAIIFGCLLCNFVFAQHQDSVKSVNSDKTKQSGDDTTRTTHAQPNEPPVNIQTSQKNIPKSPETLVNMNEKPKQENSNQNIDSDSSATVPKDDAILLDDMQQIQEQLNTLNFDNIVVKGEIEEVPLDIDDDEEDEEINELVNEDIQEEPLTEEEQKGKDIYEEAIKVKNEADYDKTRYLNLLEAASHHKYTKAQEDLSFLLLLGNLEQIHMAKALFEELSNKGSPRGQMGLGFLHAVGIGFNSSQAKTLVYYTFAALGGDSFAQMALAYKHWAGVGVPSVCETALTYYRKVANKVAEDVSVTGGSAIQRVRLEDEMDSPGSSTGILDEDLLQYYKLLADKGDMQAQVGLGQLYYQGGRGVNQDHQRAMNYFINAADNGNPNAMAFLGKMYLEGGSVVKQNNETALKYFQNAADKGNAVGQSGLGLMYLYGKGVEKDYQKAFKYFVQAADQGWVDGQLQLGNMFYSGLGVRKDIKMAIKYFNMASQSGHVLAFYNLAQIHASGTGVVRSCQTAVELFKNVAERGKWGNMFMDAYVDYRDGHVEQALLKYMLLAEMGYEVAQSNAAFILDRFESLSFGVNETYARALLYFGRSALQGNAASRLKLGDYHYYGHGTDVDFESSVNHYKIAAEQQHNAQAMFNLGYMHEQGYGLKQDLYLAKRFYDMAAETSVDAQVAVNLALVKLNMLFLMKNFEELDWNNMMVIDLNLDNMLGPDWDLYVMTTLAIILGIVVYFRRPPPQQQ